MTEWYLIKPQPTLNSGFEKDEFAAYAQDSFDELLTETQLGKDIVFCKGAFDGENFEVEVQSQGIIQSETPDAYTQGYKRQLLTRISEIADYKYIKYDGFIWLIMTEPTDNRIYDKCVLHQCNYVLKWQIKNKDIVYYPAYIENASQYNTGEEGNKFLMLGYNQLMAYISMDDISMVIDRELRMFIDYNPINPLPYKVTRHDTVCYSYGRNRVVNMVLTEDQYNPDTDSIEHWLCDYNESNKSNVSNNSPITITYKGNPTIRIGGSKTFKSDGVSVIFSIIVSDMFKNMISLKQLDDYTCKITIDNNSILVGSSFRLIATDNNGNTSDKLITVMGGV